MGHAHSKTSSDIKNNVINTTDVSNINKNVVNAATETLIKSASSCSSSVNQSNSCNLKNINAKGNVTIGGGQTNKATVDFSCVQSSTASNSMVNSMKQSIMNELNNISDSEIIAKINAAASAAQKAGFGGTGGSSDASVNTNVSTEVTNQSKTTIENIYEQNLKNNFNSETVQECIGRTTQKNEINAEDVTSGENISAECAQSNTLEQVQECKQLSEAANKTLIETANELGFKISTENTTTTTADTEATTETKQEDTGPIQDFGNAISGIASSISGALGMASLGVAAPFIIYSCCCVCCILLCCVSSMMVKSKSGSDAGAGADSSYASTGGGKVNYDSFGYIGNLGINIISDILSDSSPLFD